MSETYDSVISDIRQKVTCVDTREMFVLKLSAATGKNFVGIDCYSLALLCVTASPSQLRTALVETCLELSK